MKFMNAVYSNNAVACQLLLGTGVLAYRQRIISYIRENQLVRNVTCLLHGI